MHELANRNIILIGMPSAGKTTIGKQLAKLLKRPFYDVDECIVKKENMSIADIFKNQSESAFRKLEKACVKELACTKNTIISTGGGTILDDENVVLLKQNGIFIFIDRSLDLLISKDASRPLSSSKEALTKLYEIRYPLYKKYADITIINNTSKKDAIKQIIEKLKNK